MIRMLFCSRSNRWALCCCWRRFLVDVSCWCGRSGTDGTIAFRWIVTRRNDRQISHWTSVSVGHSAWCISRNSRRSPWHRIRSSCVGQSSGVVWVLIGHMKHLAHKSLYTQIVGRPIFIITTFIKHSRSNENQNKWKCVGCIQYTRITRRKILTIGNKELQNWVIQNGVPYEPLSRKMSKKERTGWTRKIGWTASVNIEGGIDRTRTSKMTRLLCKNKERSINLIKIHTKKYTQLYSYR